MGFICEKSVLVSLFPDGGNTYCGKLINQHGILYEFDIDLDDFKYSWCIEISFDNGKTSRIEAAAFEMFAGLRKESDRGE